MQAYKDTVIGFRTFLAKIIAVMEIQKKQLTEMIAIRDQHDAGYKGVMTALLKYED